MKQHTKIEEYLESEYARHLAHKIQEIAEGLELEVAISAVEAVLANLLIERFGTFAKYKPRSKPRYLKDKYGFNLMKCVDHKGTLEIDEEHYDIFEPYHLDLDGLKEIVALCEQKKLAVRIDGTSPYYPGKTVMVRLTKDKGGFGI